VLEKTYLYDTGTILNGKATSITAAARQACLELEKPELASTDTIWTPSDSYDYKLLPSKMVKQYVLRRAGAGKIDMRCGMRNSSN
jgi:pectate lyase